MSLPVVEIVCGPRERLALYGRTALSDAELLAVLIGTGTAHNPVTVVAQRLLEQAGGLRGLVQLSLQELEAQTGIGRGKASRILAALELGTRICARPLARERAITGSRDIDAALRPRFVHETREHFLAIALDAKNHPIAEITVGIGGLLACSITPADVFRPVLRAAAVSVVFVHNHPSGDPVPSEADVNITQRLQRAGELLGVSVLDHIVIGRQGYFSFLDAGLMTPAQPVTPE